MDLNLPLFHGLLRAEDFSPFDQHGCRVIHRLRGACHAGADHPCPRRARPDAHRIGLVSVQRHHVAVVTQFGSGEGTGGVIERRFRRAGRGIDRVMVNASRRGLCSAMRALTASGLGMPSPVQHPMTRSLACTIKLCIEQIELLDGRPLPEHSHARIVRGREAIVKSQSASAQISRKIAGNAAASNGVSCVTRLRCGEFQLYACTETHSAYGRVFDRAFTRPRPCGRLIGITSVPVHSLSR